MGCWGLPAPTRHLPLLQEHPTSPASGWLGSRIPAPSGSLAGRGREKRPGVPPPGACGGLGLCTVPGHQASDCLPSSLRPLSSRSPSPACVEALPPILPDSDCTRAPVSRGHTRSHVLGSCGLRLQKWRVGEAAADLGPPLTVGSWSCSPSKAPATEGPCPVHQEVHFWLSQLTVKNDILRIYSLAGWGQNNKR